MFSHNMKLFFLSSLLLLLLFLSASSLARPVSPISPHLPSDTVRQRGFASFFSGVSSFFASVYNAGGRGRRPAGDGHGGAGIYVEASSGRATSTLILLHGMSDSASNYALATLALRRMLPDTRFIFPQADERFVTFLGRRTTAWFDILSSDIDAMENKEGILSAVSRVERIIEGEVQKGIKGENIAVIGLSQGGAVALSAYMRSRTRIGGVVGVSTWLPLRNTYPQEESDANKQVKALLMHGTEDDVVKFSYAQESARVLRQLGRDVQLIPFEGEGHLLNGVILQVILSIVGFVRRNNIV